MLGPSVYKTLGFVPRALAIVPPGPHRNLDIAVLAADRPAVYCMSMDTAGAFFPCDTLLLPENCQSIAISHADNMGNIQYVIQHAESPTLTVWTRSSSSPSLTTTITVPKCLRMKIADINGDGYPDILLFGRTSAGVATLLNSGKGEYNLGPVLFPEISVSDIQVTDLNGDGIPDVFVLDWLSNKLLVSYGITRMVFSAQMTISLPAEPADLAITAVTPKHTVRIAITFPKEHRIEVREGNGFGEFPVIHAIAAEALVSGIALVDMNSDGAAEVASLTTRGLMLVPAIGKRDYGIPQFYGVAPIDGAWWIGNVGAIHYPGIVAVNPETKVLTVVSNAAWTASALWPNSYALGKDPQGLALCDVDGDGRLDIATANHGSGTVSVLLNRGNGRFFGQMSVQVPKDPSQLVSIDYKGHCGFIVSQPEIDRISVITRDSTGGMMWRMIPTREQPEIIKNGMQGPGDRLEIPVLAKERSEREVTLSLFEELGDGQFIERTIRTTAQSHAAAMTACRTIGTGTYSILFAERNRLLHQTTVYSAMMTHDASVGKFSAVARFSDSSTTPCVLDLVSSSSGTLRGLVTLGEPRNAIGVFSVDSTTGMSGVPVWINDIHVKEPNGILYRDVDGDGREDLLVHDPVRGALALYRGDDAGRFLPRENLCEGSDLGSFAVGRLSEANVDDLVLIHTSTSSVSVLRDPFRKRTP